MGADASPAQPLTGRVHRCLEIRVADAAAVAVLGSHLPRRRDSTRWPWARPNQPKRDDADPRLVAAIVDRITFNAHIIETGTQSYRLATSKTSNRKRAS